VITIKRTHIIDRNLPMEKEYYHHRYTHKYEFSLEIFNNDFVWRLTGFEFKEIYSSKHIAKKYTYYLYDPENSNLTRDRIMIPQDVKDEFIKKMEFYTPSRTHDKKGDKNYISRNRFPIDWNL